MKWDDFMAVAPVIRHMIVCLCYAYYMFSLSIRVCSQWYDGMRIAAVIVFNFHSRQHMHTKSVWSIQYRRLSRPPRGTHSTQLVHPFKRTYIRLLADREAAKQPGWQLLNELTDMEAAEPSSSSSSFIIIILTSCAMKQLNWRSAANDADCCEELIRWDWGMYRRNARVAAIDL